MILEYDNGFIVPITPVTGDVGAYAKFELPLLLGDHTPDEVIVVKVEGTKKYIDYIQEDE